jgi:secondary thiamine-phosphate synthase enzyme
MTTGTIEVSLKVGPDIAEITGPIRQLVKDSGIRSGQVSVFMTGSTGSLTTIEYESGVVEDLKRAIDALAPPGLNYEHEKAWHDGNGHSHVQAALLGPSITVPVRDGQLRLGTWQQVVAINHDNRARSRNVEVTVLGST